MLTYNSSLESSIRLIANFSQDSIIST